MKHIKTLITIIAAALLIISIFTGAAAADNVTNNSTEQVNALDNSTDPSNVWYRYYKSLQDPNLRTKLHDIRMNSSLSADAKQALRLSLLGCDYRFITAVDYSTHIVNGDGTLTYNLRAIDWWENPVEEGDEFAQTIATPAQVEILYNMYREKYNEYVYATLLQAQAEGDTLYPIYLENNHIMDFDEYVYATLPQSTAEISALDKIFRENLGA